jgi:hypothetical protein
MRNPGNDFKLLADLGLSQGLQIFRGRFAGLAVNHDFEGNALTFPKLAKACAFHGADVNENILAATFRLDESVSLLRIEPFHGTVIHKFLLTVT